MCIDDRVLRDELKMMGLERVNLFSWQRTTRMIKDIFLNVMR